MSTPSGDEVMTARRLLEVISYLRNIENEFNMLTLATLLLVGTHEGITAGEIERRLGVTKATASRHVQALGSYAPRRGELGGMELVKAETDPFDVRRKPIKLTPKGQRVFSEITEMLKK